jgi:hypothetical protein
MNARSRRFCALLFIILFLYSGHGENTLCASGLVPPVCNLDNSSLLYAEVTINQEIPSGSSSVNIEKTGDYSLFVPNTLVMLIQMQGSDYNPTNTNSYGDGVSGRGFTTLKNVGTYEIRQIISVVDSTTVQLDFDSAIERGPYSSTIPNVFQIVLVPFCDLAIISSTITVPPWNGITGGVFALLANSLQMDAPINASSAGFRGADYLLGQNARDTFAYAVLDVRSPSHPVMGSRVREYVVIVI